jgi:hypothetical protein
LGIGESRGKIRVYPWQKKFKIRIAEGPRAICLLAYFNSSRNFFNLLPAYRHIVSFFTAICKTPSVSRCLTLNQSYEIPGQVVQIQQCFPHDRIAFPPGRIAFPHILIYDPSYRIMSPQMAMLFHHERIAFPYHVIYFPPTLIFHHHYKIYIR